MMQRLPRHLVGAGQSPSASQAATQPPLSQLEPWQSESSLQGCPMPPGAMSLLVISEQLDAAKVAKPTLMRVVTR
jgi:hypothetical protein